MNPMTALVFLSCACALEVGPFYKSNTFQINTFTLFDFFAPFVARCFRLFRLFPTVFQAAPLRFRPF